MSAINPVMLALLLAPALTLAAPTSAPSKTPGQQPDFIALAKPHANAAAGMVDVVDSRAIKPYSILRQSPIGTQTVAERQPDGRVQVSCHTRRIAQRPMLPERTP